MNKFIVALAILLLAPAARAEPLSETIQLATGAIRGLPRSDAGVLIYNGIPFAAPPVGEFRWQAPQPPLAWTGTRDATRPGDRCWWDVPGEGLGSNPGAVPQSEDCLFLNVWTAATSAAERRPVFVWIHGGGFQFGTSKEPRTEGTHIAQKGAVVVTMNYRLGVFGFFAHPLLRTDGHLAGNFGIQDQIAALKWVRANIENFGGDPNNVTIAGESSGSQAVSLLMASPLAKGLFQRAIGESGSSLQELSTLMEIALRGAAFTSALGARTIADLRAMPAEKINMAAAWDFRGGAPMVFAPGTDQAVIPGQLADLFGAGRQADVPLLAGYNRREDFPFLAETIPHHDAAEFRAGAERVFGAARMPAFLGLYPADTDAAAKQSAEALLGDIRQKAETWRWLTLHARTGKSPVYGYEFSFVSGYSPIASHVAEIPYVFGNFAPQFFAPKAPPAGPEDHALSATMMSYWVNFATSGNPNGPGLPTWPDFRAADALLQIKPDGQLSAAPPDERQIARFHFLDGFLIAASKGQE